jgi:methylated-DNA-[protein]-cysteine S-methyltransferase
MEPAQIESTLPPHFSRCPSCRRRWERALQIYEARTALDGHVAAATKGRIDLPSSGIIYTGMLSPLGMLWVAAGPRGLVRLDCFSDEVEFCHELERAGGGTPRGYPEYDSRRLAGVVDQLTEYFEGRRRVFDLPVDLSAVTGFQRSVLEGVLSVPCGQVQSYGDIARRAGKPGGARAVGAAVATNPIGIVVPCHRIVRSDGTPGEYAIRAVGSCGSQYKLLLLRLEGTRLPIGFRSPSVQ